MRIEAATREVRGARAMGDYRSVFAAFATMARRNRSYAEIVINGAQPGQDSRAPRF
jgi:hypothetical protein